MAGNARVGHLIERDDLPLRVYDGSMHMMLPPEVVDEVLVKGWGEPHPMARRGIIPPTAVMVYAPRDAAEVDVVVQVLGVSYRFARGEELAV